MRALWLISIICVLSACAVPVKEDTTLTHGITYLDKTQSDSKKFARSISPTPGMRIVMSSIALLGKERNAIIPMPGTFIWNLPAANEYGTEDFFAVSSLLASADTRGDTTSPRDPMDCWHVIGKHIKDETTNDEDKFFDAFAMAVIKPVIESLQIEYSGISGAANGSPAWYRALANKGRAPNFGTEIDNPPKTLLFKVAFPEEPISCKANVDCANRTDTVEVFAWGQDAFFTQPPTTFDGADGFPNIWVGRAAHGKTPQAHRFIFTLEVPVFFQGLPGRRFVPFYSSVADIEKQFAIRVTGLARRAEYFPDTKFIPENDHSIIRAKPSPGTRFDIWFGSIGHEAELGALLTRSENLKQTTLIAADDVISWRLASR